MGFMRQTFDVDPGRLPNGYLVFPDVREVIRRLARCPYAEEILWRESASGNGWHVSLRCARLEEPPAEPCELCRLCFDSDFRFMLDQLFRKPHQRNVLWKRKTYHKGGHVLVLEAGEWV